MASHLAADIVVAKVTSMLVLGGSAFVVTMLPVLVGKRISSKSPEAHKKTARSDFVLSLFLSFGGGVLLCTTFLHLLPEVSENIATLQNNGGIPKDLPLSLPELIMCCGFFTMYIVEEVVHKFLHKRHEKVRKVTDDPVNVSSAVLVDTDVALVETYQEIFREDVFKVNFSSPHKEDVNVIPTNTRNYATYRSDPLRDEVNHPHCHDVEHDSHYDHDHRHHESGDHHTVTTDELPSLRELLLVLALTVHETFEGLAIGLESAVDTVWYMMAAVAVHKSVIAFCIGVELVSGHLSMLVAMLYALIFAIASPFGIAVGLLLTTSTDNHLTVLLSVVLQGMATGTLLYVVFFEILKRDGQVEGGLAQMAVVMGGFVIMAAVTALISA